MQSQNREQNGYAKLSFSQISTLQVASNTKMPTNLVLQVVIIAKSHEGCFLICDQYFRQATGLGPLLLTWINFDAMLDHELMFGNA